MRKRIVTHDHQKDTPPGLEWLNLEALTEVEITSEDVNHPIEFALLPDQVLGWRAAEPGKQTIRLVFNYPQTLRRIWLNFVETDIERTQEFVLRWSADNGLTFTEIVRQQWNFSPAGETSEAEEFHVVLPAVTVIELSIIPDISGGNAIASLEQLRLA